MSDQVSVVVLTKNRAQLLDKCLHSLVQQQVLPDEVVVVDNNSEDHTPQVLRQYQGQLPLHTYQTDSRGYPALYNFAASKATQDLVAFLDDDCIAQPQWVMSIKSAHNSHPDAVLQGVTESYPRSNIYAAIMGDHYQNWLIAHTDPATGTMDVVDNKNCALPRKTWQQVGLFNEQLVMGSEDIELGKRLVQMNIPIMRVETMRARHRERTSFLGFSQQHWRIAQSEKKLDRRLAKKHRLGGVVTRKTWLNMRSFFSREWQYLKNFQLLQVVWALLIYIWLAVIRIVGYFVK